MPEMDGYTLIQQIRALSREKWGQIPAIASGYQWHLTKPLEPDELVQIILILTSD
jgi:CheY-like chemotaxis protein